MSNVNSNFHVVQIALRYIFSRVKLYITLAYDIKETHAFCSLNSLRYSLSLIKH